MKEESRDLTKALGIRKPTDGLHLEFRKRMHEFADLLAKYDISIQTESLAGLEAWSLMSQPDREGVVAHFSKYLGVCIDAHSSGISLRDNKALTTYALKKANLFSENDLHEFLDNEDVVETYNINNVQTFRSVNFFDFCNYPLMEILTREWFILYERLSTVTEAIMRDVQQAISSKKMIPFNVPPHIMKEKFSEPRGVFSITLRYCCPLFSAPGIIGGFLCTQAVKELDIFSCTDEKLFFLK